MNKKLEEVLQKAENTEKAKLCGRYFKTGKGEYGEGDKFLGIIVPLQRKISREFDYLEMDEIQELLDSKYHEKRVIGLFILILKYEKASKENNLQIKKQIFEFYLKNASKNNVNNWDLVDISAPNIVGDYLLDKNRDILYELVKSNNLWERRISIISTLAFIRQKDLKDTLKISEILLLDKHDLIHKAVGWMLREAGKRDVEVLRKFLKDNYKKMPRTMLRYSIEKFSLNERKEWLLR
ncbi:MAG: DNA alkylation repair protein [Candidatus Pacearchaeota archaeon]|jgi:3-methyladenine DNA glycosylase AlkD